jgi:hypothetical protein
MLWFFRTDMLWYAIIYYDQDMKQPIETKKRKTAGSSSKSNKKGYLLAKISVRAKITKCYTFRISIFCSQCTYWLEDTEGAV